MYERFTNSARKVMQAVWREVRILDHRYVGTGEILLALLGVKDGLAVQALKHLGVSPEAMRHEILGMLTRSNAKNHLSPEVPPGLDVKRSSEYERILVQLDAMLGNLDTEVFQAAFLEGLSPDEQRDRAMCSDFQPPIKVERDKLLRMRNLLAVELIELCERRPHDLSPPDYSIDDWGRLVSQTKVQA